MPRIIRRLWHVLTTPPPRDLHFRLSQDTIRRWHLTITDANGGTIIPADGWATTAEAQAALKGLLIDLGQEFMETEEGAVGADHSVSRKS